jgi:hypothetical protein
MRFFIDGYEVDVSDPHFHFPIENVNELMSKLIEYKEEAVSNGN